MSRQRCRTWQNICLQLVQALIGKMIAPKFKQTTDKLTYNHMFSANFETRFKVIGVCLSPLELLLKSAIAWVSIVIRGRTDCNQQPKFQSPSSSDSSIALQEFQGTWMCSNIKGPCQQPKRRLRHVLLGHKTYNMNNKQVGREMGFYIYSVRTLMDFRARVSLFDSKNSVIETIRWWVRQRWIWNP